MFIVERIFLGAPPIRCLALPKLCRSTAPAGAQHGYIHLLATMLVCFLIGMHSYSWRCGDRQAAWSIGIPLEAVMLKISDGVSNGLR